MATLSVVLFFLMIPIKFVPEPKKHGQAIDKKQETGEPLN
jgi:hypothetical protein